MKLRRFQSSETHWVIPLDGPFKFRVGSPYRRPEGVGGGEPFEDVGLREEWFAPDYFDGVSARGDVYLNGLKAGEIPLPFLPFESSSPRRRMKTSRSI
ncbi:MAG: hypothetical protein ACUVXI_05225 [bacterium]